MKKLFTAVLMLHAFLAGNLQAQQTTLSLDSCRSLAIANNKELLMSQENINAARYQHKAAVTNYLPKVSLQAGYVRSQREVELLSDESKAKLNNLGNTMTTMLQSTVGAQAQAIAQQMPQMASPPWVKPSMQLEQELLMPSPPTLATCLPAPLR